MKPKLKKPAALKTGDTIRIVASSSPFDKAAFLAGVTLLESWGFNIKYQKNIFDREPYLAGSDQRRFDELASALADNTTKAILFARGGYGAMRLLALLDKKRIKTPPKIILGYSDLTALLNYFEQRLNWATFYGPVVAKDMSATSDSATLNSLKAALTSTKPLGEFNFNESLCLKSGKATAPITGGCLSIITSLMGTPYEINTNEKILFLEDINEKPYQIDRMLTQLKLAGKFKKCCGVIFGSLNGPNPHAHYEQTVMSVLGNLKIPILMNFPAGHSPIKITLPLGVNVCLDAKKKSLTYLESATI